MLQKCKRPASIILALLMCLSLLTGIVLPAASAAPATDAYAMIGATPVEGESNVYQPADNVYFVNYAWDKDAPASEGEEFDYTYGDGTSFGDGKTYRLTFGVNTVTNFPDLRTICNATDPADQNKLVFVFAPGSHTGSTNPNGVDTDWTCKVPSVSDPTQEDFLNIYFLGPQAGKSPVTAIGSKDVANGRSVDASKEFVFGFTFWTPFNAVLHMDGMAGRNNLKFFSPSNTNSQVRIGLYIENLYAEVGNSSGGVQLFAVGSNNSTNTRMTVFHLTDSYFVQTNQDKNSQGPVIQANDMLMENNVFYGFDVSANDQYHQNQHIKFAAGAVASASCKFLGEYSGKANIEIKNNSFIDWTSSHIIRIPAVYADYGDKATINIQGNQFLNVGGNSFGDMIYMDKITEAQKTKINITENLYRPSPASYATSNRAFINFASGTTKVYDYTIKDNILYGDSTVKRTIDAYCAGNSSGMTIYDMSGNLYLNPDGTVRPMRASYTSNNMSTCATIYSDIYLSEDMVGGVREAFTVRNAAQNLLVTESRVLTALATGSDEAYFDGNLHGAITVVPEDGVTYSTKDLFTFENKDVKLVGVYSDADYTNEVSSFTKGFGTLYVKAEYKDGKATVLYTMAEPTRYVVVDPTGVGSYTFNGTTYTPDNATFVDTLKKGADATVKSNATGALPATDVVLLMPGTYSETATTFAESVALIGPGFGKKASDGTSAEVLNGRGVDPTKEAVFTGNITISACYTACNFAICGIAFDLDNLPTGGSTGNGAAIKLNSDKNKTLGFITIKDTYFNVNKSRFFFCYGTNWTPTATDIRYAMANMAVDGCYFTGVSNNALAGEMAINYVKFTNSTFNNISTTATNTGVQYLFKYWNIPSTGLHFIPKTVGVDVDHCYFGNCVAGANKYDYRGMYVCFNDRDCTQYVARGTDLVARISNNTIYNMGRGDFCIGSPAPKSVTTSFTDNRVERSAPMDGTIYDYYNGTASKVEMKSIDISGNVLINCNKPWNLHTANNAANVDENFYAGADGKAKPIIIGTGTVKSGWYYLDEAMTVKSTDVALADDGYTAFTDNGFDGRNNVVIDSGKAITPATLKVVDGATLEGVYTDEDLTAEAASLVSGTYYVNISKNGIGLVTKLELTVPCVHPATHEEVTKEPTCAPGSKNIVCDTCGAVLETVVIAPIQDHNWDAGEITKVPTCVEKGTIHHVCTVCATETDMDLDIDPDAHQVGEWEVKTAADCENDGEEVKVCALCSKEVESRPIAALGHDWETEKRIDKEPTCVEEGSKSIHCTRCDATKDAEPIAKVEHNYVGTVTKPENCMEDGIVTYVCSVCGDTYTRPIPSSGNHNFVEEVIIAPTCTEEGLSRYTCAGCGTVVEVPVAKVGHNYRSEITKNPTCAESGLETFTCVNCADSYTQVIEPTGKHKYVATVTQEATCVDDGYMKYTCQICSDTYSEIIPNKGGHQFGEWTTVVAPTCVQVGLRRHTCFVCGEEATEALPLIDHEYSDEWVIDIQPTGTTRGEKSHHCVVCDARTDITDIGLCEHSHTDGEWHVEKEATCSAEGVKYQVCSDCGDPCNQTPIAKTEHSFYVDKVLTAPTCTEDGTESLLCSVCGATETRTVKATGHIGGAWETITPATCTEAGQQQQHCSACDVVIKTSAIPAKGHGNFTWKVTVAATCTENGTKSYICDDCGFVSETKQILATGHKDSHRVITAATCTTDGLNEYTCSVCGDVRRVVTKATGHNAGAWVVTKPATSLANGLKVKTCKTCGVTVATEAIPRLYVSNASARFKDVPANAWYKSAVDFVVGSGLFNGTSATTFSPNMAMTRGMFVTVLGRLAGVDATKYTTLSFDDVNPNAYYHGYIEWAKKNDIVDGTDTYIFEPDRAVTRQEMCKIIVSYSKFAGISLKPIYAKANFKDSASIARWAASDVFTCQRAGVIKGCDGNTFRPTKTATRAEVATLMMRYYKLAIA